MIKKAFTTFFIVLALFVTAYTTGSQTVQAQTPYNPVPYEEIGSKLEEYERESDRVSVEVVGQSTLGNDLYAVVISDPQDEEGLEKSEILRELMIEDPNEALNFVEANPDVKVPFMVNGSIHGNEYVGTDAVLKLIERFAYENDETTKNILENNILVFNVVNNPDGRILGTRQNAEGFDLNREHVTQLQPETNVNVALIKEWLPMVFLDLHGYIIRSTDTPGLLGAATPPYNPNIETDIYLKWGMEQSLAMEEELVKNRDNYESDLYRNMQGTHIPARDQDFGWDGYPPIFTPMYAQGHGAFAYTNEAPTNSWDGVRWHVDATMGALKYATENKLEMLKAQIEVFRRGVEFDHPNHESGFLPKAYVIPDQADSSITVRAINHLIKNGIEVSEAKESFTVNGEQYDSGTYIVFMNQARAGLANNLLWEGEDISDDVDSMYDISAWSLSELWDFDVIAANTSIDIAVKEVRELEIEGQLRGDGPYEIRNSSIGAVNLVNQLIQNNISVYKGSNGHFYVEQSNGDTLLNAVQQSGITLETVPLPEEAKLLEKVNVAILEDRSQHGIRTALKRLGFHITEIAPQEIAENGLDNYDALVANGSGNHDSDSYKRNIQEFISNGGKYIAIGANASNVAVQLGLADTIVNTGSRHDNGIVSVNYKDTTLTSGYNENDIGFVYNPVWYTDIEDDRVIASFADQDFFRAGFWQNSETAQGQPTIIKGHNNEVTLFGLEVGFRAHPEYLYRLLSNAIYPGEETILTTASGTKARAERFAEEGEFESDEVARSLKMHLTAVSLYEERGQAEKVVHHMEGFKVLLDHQKELISDKAFNILQADADSLIKKWQ
ncbi:M14 family zinc carboxypeptidase [Virgibacillus sp. YIM 98842]|uniref:FIMAH domain-containing protein n=1 Tax=Virgibacillus sp. YIM 98842 TaxID=2663533 RepID=UPI0013DB098C|nr:M14 family zinc carboxypeptidase [Virgibacillus sp. YIM 98842]